MLPRAENEFPAQIVALRRQLEVLHQELGRKNGECEHLQVIKALIIVNNVVYIRLSIAS